MNVRKFYLLSERGVLIQGQVTKTEPQNHHAVYYSYSIDQRDYSGVGSAGNMNRRIDEVTVGDKAPVTYDSLNPESSCLGDPNKQLSSLMRGVIFISLFPTLCFFSYFVKKGIRENSEYRNSAA